MSPWEEQQLLQDYVRRSLTEHDPPLPPRDQAILAPGQLPGGGRPGQQLHDNAYAVYGGPPRPPPAGDEVLPSGAPLQAPPGVVPPNWVGKPYAPYGGMPLAGRGVGDRQFYERGRQFQDKILAYPPTDEDEEAGRAYGTLPATRISDVRSRPMAEQQAMQDYVRQRLNLQPQLPLPF